MTTLSLHLVNTGSEKDEGDANEQEKSTDKRISTVQRDGQGDSVEATKFSLASLLTSRGSDTSQTAVPISSSSEVTPASLTDTSQSLHQCSDDSQATLTSTSTLSSPRKAPGSNFSENGIDKWQLFKRESSYKQIMKSRTDTTLSSDKTNDLRTSPVHISNAIGSDTHESSDHSATTMDSSTVKPVTEVSQPEPTAKCDGTCISDINGSSASKSRSKTGGLMDLLTTAVDDKDSTVVLDSHEDEWMSPQTMNDV